GRRVWDGRPPTPDGQGGTLSIYITRAKILYELKTRGLEKFSVSDLLQQPVMPMISIHIFARGKTPWTSQTRTLGRALIEANRRCGGVGAGDVVAAIFACLSTIAQSWRMQPSG